MSGYAAKVAEEARVRGADLIRAFHDLFYAAGKGTWGAARFLGVPCQKNPFDLWVMQEILFETRPEIIIETGTYQGGTTAFLAVVCNALGRGEVISIDTDEAPDIDPRFRIQSPRITYFKGSSTAAQIIDEVHKRVQGKTVAVTLDSDHSLDHVATELRLYSPLVSPGHYLIVEDTNTSGPREALDAFLATAPPFEVDRDREKFLLTFNPGGYLRRRMT